MDASNLKDEGPKISYLSYKLNRLALPENQT